MWNAGVASFILVHIPHPIYWISILILSSHLVWSLSLSFHQQNPVYNSPLPHTFYMLHHSHFSRCVIGIILDEQYISLSSSLHSFLHAPIILSLSAQISSSAPYSQTTFLPQCERPCFTPILKHANYCSVYLYLYIYE